MPGGHKAIQVAHSRVSPLREIQTGRTECLNIGVWKTTETEYRVWGGGPRTDPRTDGSSDSRKESPADEAIRGPLETHARIILAGFSFVCKWLLSIGEGRAKVAPGGGGRGREPR